MNRTVLIIGLGNPDRGDDGIGARVVGALAGRLPEGVKTVVRAGDMLALVEEWVGADAVICIDAAASMGAPGGIHRIDGHDRTLLPEPGLASSHAFGLAEAIALSQALGTAPPVLIVYAIEGRVFDIGAPLSTDVAAAVAEVAAQVLAEAVRLRDGAEAIHA
jgi:hydrogenase maturation protease